MVRPCNAQRNFRKPKRTSQHLQASVIIINNNKKKFIAANEKNTDRLWLVWKGCQKKAFSLK